MANTTAEWVAAVAKIRGYVKVYLGLKSLNAKQQAALQTDLKTLDADLASLQASLAAPEPMSSDPQIALFQILKATGHPVTLNADGETIATDPDTVAADATSEQQRELALLGYFGTPGSRPGIDYSLNEQYYASDGAGNWQPKDPDQAIWATYLAAK